MFSYLQTQNHKFLKKIGLDNIVNISGIKSNKITEIIASCNTCNGNSFSCIAIRTKNERFFLKNFKERLLFLKKQYNEDENFQKMVRDIFIKPDCCGSFSELSTLYFFSKLTHKVKIEVQPLEDDTLSKEFKKKDGSIKNVSFVDGEVELEKDYPCFCYEVKSLQRNSHKIIDDIKKSVLKKLKETTNEDYYITCDYPFYIDEREIDKKKKSEIIEDIVEYLKIKKKPRWDIGLSFKIYKQEPKITSEIHEVNYFKQAQNWEKYPLENAYQFIISHCFIKVFVIHPLFYKELNNNTDRKNLFRSLARRVFVNLTKDESNYPAPENHSTSLKYSDVAKKLDGILFIYDSSWEKSKKFTTKDYLSAYYSYFYLNPNSYKSEQELAILGLFRMKINKVRFTPKNYILESDFDDFEFDNY